ncbi:MAG: hypothetical protein AB8G15_07265 [Saprospiraceae bacterium]
MKILFSALLVMTFVLILACADSAPPVTTSAKTIYNPNGDSELTLLMRTMFDDAMRMKQSVAEGEVPKVLATFKAIHTAEATEPDKAKSETFKNFANAYLATVEALQQATPAEVKDIYEGMVASCMSCHRAMCPGPMVRIKKLHLSYQD